MACEAFECQSDRIRTLEWTDAKKVTSRLEDKMLIKLPGWRRKRSNSKRPEVSPEKPSAKHEWVV